LACTAGIPLKSWRLRQVRRLCALNPLGYVISRVVGAGHACIQNLRRGHSELGVDVDPRHRLAAVFTRLAPAV
jgi:hypothetical protein